MISMGTDTGNSMRGPSGHQGLVGLRSSIGQTSRSAANIPFIYRTLVLLAYKQLKKI